MMLKEMVMGKVNFTKVEQALEAGLIKMEAQNLLYLADLASSFGEADSDTPPVLKPAKFKWDENHQLFVQNLATDLRKLRKKDREMDTKLGLDRGELNKLLENPKEITEEEWEKIREIRRKLNEHKKEMKKRLGTISDQDLVKTERKKQVNRRFNIKDNWLPLQ